MFDEFWARYPKKKSKGQAERAWVRIKPDETLFAAILSGLERAKASYDWRKDGGKYIPYPATWLNAKGWEDEYQQQGGADNGRADPAKKDYTLKLGREPERDYTRGLPGY